MKKVHIGKEIEKKLSERKMSITEFAERISYSRRSVYRMFEKNSIDIELLERISTVLKFDFIEEYYSSKNRAVGNKVYVSVPIDEERLNDKMVVTFMIKEEDFQVK